MKHHLMKLSLVLCLGGTILAHAAPVFCPSDNSTVSVLLTKEDGDKKDEGKKNGDTKNSEDDCE